MATQSTSKENEKHFEKQKEGNKRSSTHSFPIIPVVVSVLVLSLSILLISFSSSSPLESQMDSVMRFFHGKDELENVASSFYDLKAKDIDGNELPFETLRGKVVLIVNVASECGRTRTNYKQLQPLYEEMKEKGLEILAFPCNQFLGQEPGTEAEIKSKVCTKWGATFPLMQRVQVNGPTADPVFKYLKAVTDSRPINWNFEKFLCSRKGVCTRYDGKNPDEIRPEIIRLLDEAPDASL